MERKCQAFQCIVFFSFQISNLFLTLFLCFIKFLLICNRIDLEFLSILSLLFDYIILYEMSLIVYIWSLTYAIHFQPCFRFVLLGVGAKLRVTYVDGHTLIFSDIWTQRMWPFRFQINVWMKLVIFKHAVVLKKLVVKYVLLNLKQSVFGNPWMRISFLGTYCTYFQYKYNHRGKMIFLFVEFLIRCVDKK